MVSASSHTQLFPYEVIFRNSLLKALFALTTRLGRASLFHTWPLSPGVCLVVLCQSFVKPRYVTAMPPSLGNCTDTKQALTLCMPDLKLNYHMYFLCKEKVPITNPSQQATDLFPQDPSETSNYQEQLSKADPAHGWWGTGQLRGTMICLCPAHLILISSRQVQSGGILPQHWFTKSSNNTRLPGFSYWLMNNLGITALWEKG